MTTDLDRVGNLTKEQFAEAIAAPVGDNLAGTFQPLDSTLTDLASRNIGAASATDILDRAAGDGRYAGSGSGVTSFNTRTGVVTLTSGDVTTALGFNPVTDARAISTTAPLTGGGALSGNLTLAVTAAAISKADDTNVTLTLSGTPATALLAAVTFTMGWTGTLALARGGTGSGTAAGARTNLGLVIGTDVEAHDATLTAFAAVNWSAGVQIPTLTGADTFTLKTVGSAAGNILDKTAGDALYQPLDSDLTTWAGITPGTGVGTALAVNVGSAGALVVLGGAGGTPSSLTLTNATGLPVAGGGTGASTAASARTNLGLDTMATQAASAVNITGGSATSLTSLSATAFAIKSQTRQQFLIRLTNTAGTAQHRIGAPSSSSAAGNFFSKINAASQTLTNTPTGTDSSTAFAAGGKISSASTSIFIFDTAAQIAADQLMSAQIIANNTGTSYAVWARFESQNVNGVTQIRLVVQLLGLTTASGVAFSSAIGVGQVIDILLDGYLA